MLDHLESAGSGLPTVVQGGGTTEGLEEMTVNLAEGNTVGAGETLMPIGNHYTHQGTMSNWTPTTVLQNAVYPEAAYPFPHQEMPRRRISRRAMVLTLCMALMVGAAGTTFFLADGYETSSAGGRE
jgi:hypothetical protein